MVELTVGSRFWYKDKLCEVVETEIDYSCNRCVFYADANTCDNTECRAGKRHDVKSVFFKEAKE